MREASSPPSLSSALNHWPFQSTVASSYYNALANEASIKFLATPPSATRPAQRGAPISHINYELTTSLLGSQQISQRESDSAYGVARETGSRGRSSCCGSCSLPRDGSGQRTFIRR